MFQTYFGRSRGLSTSSQQAAAVGTDAAPAQRPTSPRSNSTDPAPQGSPYANPQLSSSQSSLVSNKKRPLFRTAVSKIISLQAATSSQVSLTPPTKVRTPLAAVVTLEDAFSTPKTEDDALSVASIERSVNNPKNLVEADRDTIRRLEEQLAVAQKQLTEATERHLTSQERVKTLEEQVLKREAHRKQTEEVANGEKVTLIEQHAMAMDAQRLEVQGLQQSLEALKHESGEISRENDLLRSEIVGLKEEREQDGARIKAIENEVHATNTAMRELEDRSKADLAKSEEERRKLVDQVHRLRQQSQDSEEEINARCEQIQHLRATMEQTADTLREAEATIGEKTAMIDDLQHQNTLLGGELGLLQRQIVEMEEGHRDRESQLRLAEEAVKEENNRLSQAHAAEMEVMGRANRELQQAQDTLKRELKERIEIMTREHDALHQEIATLKDRTLQSDAEIEVMRREAEAASVAWHELNDKMVQSEKERRKLVDRADRLSQQLEDSRRAVEEVQRKHSSLQTENERMQNLVIEKESEVVKSKSVAQEILTRSREEHQQEIVGAKNHIRSLLNELSSTVTTIAQLRSSLATKSLDAEAATKLAEDRQAETSRLHQHLFALRETLTSRDRDLTETTASRLALESQLGDTIRTLRERIVSLEDERTQALSTIDRTRLQASQLEGKLRFAREKVRELQTQYELSEKTCVSLRAQLAAYEASGKGLWAAFWKWYYGQSK